MEEPHIILHVDMDAFFAAIEERDNPKLLGLPVVVGSDPKLARGVVSTANYQARKYGIHSALPITQAWRLSEQAQASGIGPRAVFLPVNSKKYNRVSKQIMAILQRFSLPIEITSIDEAYLDASSYKTYRQALILARSIKQAILTQERLTCSIGAGPNKLVAKIASDLQKPNGLTVIRPNDVLSRLAGLPIRALPGIGPKTETLLREKQISLIAHLQQIPQNVLHEWLGKWGDSLYYKAHGFDDSPVDNNWQQKSLGHQQTFAFDTLKTSFLLKTLREMTRQTVQELHEKKFSCRTVEVVVRFADFETKTHAKSFSNYTNDYELLWQQTLQLFLPFLNEQQNPEQKLIRLLGVSLSHLQLHG